LLFEPTTSTKVIVDFQGTVSGPGSHIDLKIDSGSYVPVASPRTITGLSDGPHTIYLRAVDQGGKADPTPAKWRFTVINDNDD
jgi:large repetitive protein